MPKQTFKRWKQLVNAIAGSVFGANGINLSDWDYQAAWTLGMTPDVAACKIRDQLENAVNLRGRIHNSG